MSIKALLASMRLPFLLLPLVCVFLGYSVARYAGGKIDRGALALALIGAICAHLSVNLLNEYHDFRSGLDFNTRKTPFSGGSGALPYHPQAARAVLWAGWTTLALTTLIGVWFVQRIGYPIVAIGALGMLLIVAYTPWITRHPVLCLIAPGFAFGPLMVVGACYALSGVFMPSALVVSLIPFFLTNNLLLLNQYPDIDADRAVGRNHLLIAYGRKIGARVYAVFAALAFVTLSFAIYAGYLPRGAWLGLAAAVVAMPLALWVLRHADASEGLGNKALAANVVLTIVMPALVAVGLLL